MIFDGVWAAKNYLNLRACGLIDDCWSWLCIMDMDVFFFD